MNKDGLHSYCKPCQNAKCAQYQRNSLAAKQEGRPDAEAPVDVALPEEAFTTHKVHLVSVNVLSHFALLLCTVVKSSYPSLKGSSLVMVISEANGSTRLQTQAACSHFCCSTLLANVALLANVKWVLVREA